MQRPYLGKSSSGSYQSNSGGFNQPLGGRVGRMNNQASGRNQSRGGNNFNRGPSGNFNRSVQDRSFNGNQSSGGNFLQQQPLLGSGPRTMAPPSANPSSFGGGPMGPRALGKMSSSQLGSSLFSGGLSTSAASSGGDNAVLKAYMEMHPNATSQELIDFLSRVDGGGNSNSGRPQPQQRWPDQRGNHLGNQPLPAGLTIRNGFPGQVGGPFNQMQFPPAGPLGPMGPPHMAGPPPRMVGAFQSNNAFNQNPRKRPLSQRLGTTNSNNVNGGQKKGKWTGPSRTGPNNAGQQGNNAANSKGNKKGNETNCVYGQPFAFTAPKITESYLVDLTDNQKGLLPKIKEIIKTEGKRILNFSYPMRMHTNAKVFQVVRGVQANLKKMDEAKGTSFKDEEIIAIMDDYITSDSTLRNEQPNVLEHIALVNHESNPNGSTFWYSKSYVTFKSFQKYMFKACSEMRQNDANERATTKRLINKVNVLYPQFAACGFWMIGMWKWQNRAEAILKNLDMRNLPHVPSLPPRVKGNGLVKDRTLRKKMQGWLDRAFGVPPRDAPDDLNVMILTAMAKVMPANTIVKRILDWWFSGFHRQNYFKAFESEELKGDKLLLEVSRLASPYDCDPTTTEYSSAVFSNKVFFDKGSFPTLGDLKELDLTEQQKEGLPKLKELIKKEAVKILNFSYPFKKHNASAIKYAARMIGRHYDVTEKEAEKEEAEVKKAEESKDVKEEKTENKEVEQKEGEDEKMEIKEEKKDEEVKKVDVKKTPSGGLVKGLYTDDEIIAIMEDVLTNDETLKNEQTLVLEHIKSVGKKWSERNFKTFKLYQNILYKRLQNVPGQRNFGQRNMAGNQQQNQRLQQKRLNHIQMKNGAVVLHPLITKAIHYTDVLFPQYCGMAEKLLDMFVWTRRALKVAKTVRTHPVDDSVAPNLDNKTAEEKCKLILKWCDDNFVYDPKQCTKQQVEHLLAPLMKGDMNKHSVVEILNNWWVTGTYKHNFEQDDTQQPSDVVSKDDYCAYVFYTKQEFEGHVILPLYADEEEEQKQNGKEVKTEENGNDDEHDDDVTADDVTADDINDSVANEETTPDVKQEDEKKEDGEGEAVIDALNQAINEDDELLAEEDPADLDLIDEPMLDDELDAV